MDKQALLKRYAPQYVSLSRKELSGVIVDGAGTAWVTDSYQLLMVRGFFQPADPWQLLHPKTFKPIKLEKGDEPPKNLERLVPDDVLNPYTVTLDESGIQEALQAADLMSKAAELCCKTKPPAVDLVQDEFAMLQMSFQDRTMGVSAKVSFGCTHHDINIAFNPIFFFRALKVFRDADSEQVIMRFPDSGVRPFVIEDPVQGILVLILPVKKLGGHV
ncbi:hypothetical protein BTO30_12360 [Domibacillus antri]|uniref:DNA polymerase III beta sliding clamp C-terminal domain-containing protein n=1 Tax=Domibacillus antri TaxID=1714264 RepID=A0A1Q8Q3L2_9BACI|nr:hypothetical protein [Domibacillus antri]OLN21885.1 hypothetical protein BTO30_12360 [Domibacillus antri]